MVKMTAFPKEFIPPHTLSGLAPNTPILVAFSGGADSSLLLYLLHRYAQRENTPLYAAHVHHGIRGQEADRDASFCQKTCEAMGIPFFSYFVDVPALSEASGRSPEEEGRVQRYQFFEKIMKENHIPLLATAHNLDDNAETMLFRMARGAGPGGLGGIPPVREFPGGRIVRPLLRLSKTQILGLCREFGIPFVEDSSNREMDYSRNKIRHAVLPPLVEINEETPAHLAYLGKLLREDEDYLGLCARETLPRITREGKLFLPELQALHIALQRRIWILYLEQNHISPQKAHMEALLSLVSHPSPRASVALSDTCHIGILGDYIGFCEATSAPCPGDYCLPLSPGLNQIENTPYAVFMQEGAAASEFPCFLENIYKKETSVTLNSATMKGRVFVRPRHPFDVIFSGGHHKKIKKLLCDKKIPLLERNIRPMVCDDDGVLWIPGVAQRDASLFENKQWFCFTLLHKI